MIYMINYVVRIGGGLELSEALGVESVVEGSGTGTGSGSGTI